MSHPTSHRAPISRRVVFAPHLYGQRAEPFLVLECGHSTKWATGQLVPGYLACPSCGPNAPTPAN
jgi:hypothetical protein